MSLSKHSRRFILTVSDIECELLPDKSNDELVIVFAGKVLPSTKDRFYRAVRELSVVFEDKVLT